LQKDKDYVFTESKIYTYFMYAMDYCFSTSLHNSLDNEAFFGTVCLIAVRRSDSGRTGCRRCGRVDKTPRLC